MPETKCTCTEYICDHCYKTELEAEYNAWLEMINQEQDVTEEELPF